MTLWLIGQRWGIRSFIPQITTKVPTSFWELFWEPGLHKTDKSLSSWSFHSTGRRHNKQVNTGGVRCWVLWRNTKPGVGTKSARVGQRAAKGVFSGRKWEEGLCVHLEENHFLHWYSTHKGFVTRASWVSWKIKEARVAGKRHRRKQQWGMRWERQGSRWSKPLDSYSVRDGEPIEIPSTGVTGFAFVLKGLLRLCVENWPGQSWKLGVS